jgi:hypothetical protein
VKDTCVCIKRLGQVGVSGYEFTVKSSSRCPTFSRKMIESEFVLAERPSQALECCGLL